jgi:curli biogenesis system outer membrane secretion channel CsgG
MNNTIKLGLFALVVSMLVTGCAQKVRIKALNPAEVGEMASKKKVAISNFKDDTVGLSGKIEGQIAKQKLDKKRYFTVLSRKDMAKIISEQKLQSSELMDEATSAKVGKFIGAQAIINGEIASADAESSSYMQDRVKCLQYYKDGKGCARYRYYKVKCDTTQATVSANINIVNVETAAIIYGDTLSKEYSSDSCKSGKQTLSKKQALNRLATAIATEFVYKLTPNYVYFDVGLLESIELEDATDEQHKKFEVALQYIKVARYDKSKTLLQGLMDGLDGRSYVVAYVYGVVYEATGDFDKAKELYIVADELTIEPVTEINLAMNRIDGLIEKRDEAREQMNAK